MQAPEGLRISRKIHGGRFRGVDAALGTPLGQPLPGGSAQVLAAATPSRKPQTTAWQQDNSDGTPAGTYPAEALDTDIAGVLAAWGPVHHSVLELVVGCARGHPAEQLAPVLQQN